MQGLLMTMHDFTVIQQIYVTTISIAVEFYDMTMSDHLLESR